jgi:hypothetical protein
VDHAGDLLLGQAARAFADRRELRVRGRLPGEELVGPLLDNLRVGARFESGLVESELALTVGQDLPGSDLGCVLAWVRALRAFQQCDRVLQPWWAEDAGQPVVEGLKNVVFADLNGLRVVELVRERVLL